MKSLRGACVALFCVLAWATPAAAQQTPLGGGAWSWFGDPRAVHHEGKTFVGWVDLEGDIKVMSYDHSSEQRVTAVLQARLNQDDHANPSIHVRPDGRLMVFYSAHVGPRMHYRISTEAGSVRSWGEPQEVPTNTAGGFGYTYPNPIGLEHGDQIESNDQTYLFWRGGNYNPTYSIQEHGSETWSEAKNLIHVQGERPYTKYASDGQDTIHVAFTNAHPCELGNTPTNPCPPGDVNIYYARIQGGQITNAAGTRSSPLGTPIRLGEPEEPAGPWEVSNPGVPTWVHDVAVDPVTDRPVVVFASFPSKTDHRYHYAYWTGTSWEVENIRIDPEIVSMGGSFRGDGGSPYYSGGLTLDHEDPTNVYLSRKDAFGMWGIEQWTWNGPGDWSRVVQSLSDEEPTVRPVSPRGMDNDAHSDLEVVWMRGPYPDYENYETSILARWGAENQPPVADAEPNVRSGPAPLPVTFTSDSYDPDGSITDWQWDFGDGTTGTGPEPTHDYGEPGRYFPALTVADNGTPSNPEDKAQSTFVEEIVVDLRAAPVTHTGGSDGTVAHGAIDPENQVTQWYFEYGPTMEYGARTPMPMASLSGGDSLQQVSAALAGLVPGRLYHYRLVASNATGTTEGEDRLMVAGSAPDSHDYRAAVLETDGLAAYWRLGELSGDTGAEQVSAPGDPQPPGGIAHGPGIFDERFVLGKVGAHGLLGDTAAGFDGTGGEFLVEDGPVLGQSGTMEGWFRWESGNVVMRDETGSGDEGWILGLGNSATLRYRVGGTTFNTGIPIAQVMGDGEWHHLVATKEDEQAAYYLDGELVPNVNPPAGGAGSQASTDRWHVMRNGSNDVYAAGEADEIALYLRALSAQEVAHHYEVGRQLAEREPPPDWIDPGVIDPPLPDTGGGGGVLTPTPPTDPPIADPPARPAGLASVRRGVLVVRGAPRGPNRITARRRGRAWRVTDAAAALGAGAGCRRAGSRTVACRSARVKRIEMHGGAGADSLTVAGRIRALLVGGPGADRLTGGRLVRFVGGAGADRLFRRP